MAVISAIRNGYADTRNVIQSLMMLCIIVVPMYTVTGSLFIDVEQLYKITRDFFAGEEAQTPCSSLTNT